MKVISRYIPYRTGKENEITLVFFGDVHLGNALCARKLFQREVIDAYKDQPNTYLVDMGDGMDMIVAQAGDKRFKPSMVDDRYLTSDKPIDLMIEDYAALLYPIKDQIIGMMDSNHHMTILERAGTDPTQRVAALLWPNGEWEKRLFGYSGFLVLKFHYEGNQGARVKQYVLSLCHGIGAGGKTEGGFITSLGNDAVNYVADCHVYAHNHRLQGWDRIKIGVNDNASRIVSFKELRLNSGTYLKAFSDDTSTSYSEKQRFKPNELGHMELRIRFHANGEDIYFVKRSFL